MPCADSRSGPAPAALGVVPSSNLDAALSDPAVDMVIVATPAATPAATHLELAYRCLAAHKQTLVEKPLEVTRERAEKLVAYAEQSDRRFGVVLQHRFRPAAQRLREALASGELGTVQAASVRVPWWRPQVGYCDQPGRGTLARDGGGVPALREPRIARRRRRIPRLSIKDSR